MSENMCIWHVRSFNSSMPNENSIQLSLSLSLTTSCSKVLTLALVHLARGTYASVYKVCYNLETMTNVLNNIIREIAIFDLEFMQRFNIQFVSLSKYNPKHVKNSKS